MKHTNLMQAFPEGGAPLRTALEVHSRITSSDVADIAQGRAVPTGRPISRVEAIAAMVRAAERNGLAPKSARASGTQDDDEEDDTDTDDEVVTKPAKTKTAKKKDKAVKKKKTKTKTRTPFDTHAMADSKPVKIRSEITDPYLAAVVGSTDAHRVVNRKFKADAKYRESLETTPSGGPSTTTPAPMFFPSMIGGAK